MVDVDYSPKLIPRVRLHRFGVWFPTENLLNELILEGHSKGFNIYWISRENYRSVTRFKFPEPVVKSLSACSILCTSVDGTTSISVYSDGRVRFSTNFKDNSSYLSVGTESVLSKQCHPAVTESCYKFAVKESVGYTKGGTQKGKVADMDSNLSISDGNTINPNDLNSNVDMEVRIDKATSGHSRSSNSRLASPGVRCSKVQKFGCSLVSLIVLVLLILAALGF